LGELPPIKKHNWKTLNRPTDGVRLIGREVMPFSVRDGSFALMMPYTNHDLETGKAGAQKRVARCPPPISRKDKSLMSRYARIFFRQRFQPLPADTNYDFSWWLSETPYTEVRRRELLKAWDETDGVLNEKFNYMKCFMKEEEYSEFTKHMRGIFSRHDKIKVLIGGIVKRMEEVVYKSPEFVKHVPVADRPNYLLEQLSGIGQLLETDFTAFECHFTKEVMQIIDLNFVHHMTQSIFDAQIKRIFDLMSEKNKLRFKFYSYCIEATRMSGEMTTSLMNGVANLFVMNFANFVTSMHYELTGTKLTKLADFDAGLVTEENVLKYSLKCVVEGDDGLGLYPLVTPSSHLFEQMGFTLKMEEKSSISSSKFCGILFDDVDRENLMDPMKILVKFGMSSSRYVGANHAKHMSLMRAKAFSYLYQCPGCPIVAPLCRYILRVTSRYHSGMLSKIDKGGMGFDSYKLMILRSAVGANTARLEQRNIGYRSRVLIEDMFNVPVAAQFLIEQWFDDRDEVETFPFSMIENFVPRDWVYFSEWYVFPAPANHRSKYVDFDILRDQYHTSVVDARSGIMPTPILA